MIDSVSYMMSTAQQIHICKDELVFCIVSVSFIYEQALDVKWCRKITVSASGAVPCIVCTCSSWYMCFCLCFAVCFCFSSNAVSATLLPLVVNLLCSPVLCLVHD